MIKQVLGFSDFSFVAGLSSVIFFSIFVSVLVYVTAKSADSFKKHEEIPFNEE